MSLCGHRGTEGERTRSGSGAVWAAGLRMDGLSADGKAHQRVCVVGTRGIFG
jgi:hypothetical protein